MTKKMVELVNNDGKLLALFSGILLDGLLLIGLAIYIGIQLAV